ncbi:MAG: late competence development ComFB family protein [Clostridiales bacterium]|jgi:competence protein ComFB|nr:late competence development ComFB family protein [Clostridiales bacterium]
MEGLKNYMETVVEELLGYGMKSAECCECEICKADVAAIALNNLPPQYVAGREIYAKLNTMRQQFYVDVLTEVTKAASVVAKSPRHDSIITQEEHLKEEVTEGYQ